MSCDPECLICKRLQDLAVELVADSGAEALSFAALSDRSGLPAALIAEHYPTPGACLYAPYEAASGRMLEVLARGFGDALTWPAGIARATLGRGRDGRRPGPGQALLRRCPPGRPRAAHPL